MTPHTLKRLWRRKRRRRTMTMRICGKPLSGETTFHCDLPPNATIYEDVDVEWQQMRDRVFDQHTNKGG